MMKAILIFVSFLVTLAPLSASAQFKHIRAKFDLYADSLYIDYSYFRSDTSDLARLELYYQVHHKGLNFAQSGENYTAAYRLNIEVIDDDGNIAESFERDRQVVLRAEDAARTRTDYRTSLVSLDVEPGKYVAHFHLQDRETGLTLHRKLDVKIDEVDRRRPRMSGVEFLETFEKKPDARGVFAKADLILVPSVHRAYGSLEDDRLAYYFEIYPDSKERPVVFVETRVRHFRRGLLYRDTVHIPWTDSTMRQLREISLSEFLPGEYELEIAVRGRRNKQLCKSNERFRIAWSQDGMVRNDWEATVAQLRLFSEDTDVGDMKDIVGFAERLAAFEAFWRERDPTDGTRENEAKIAFYYRVQVANERFGIMRMDGWRSDRGRIFIRYGEPDYLIDEPFAPDRLPYQIWQYVTLVPIRQFIFVDEREDGDYRLQFPFDGIVTGSLY